MNGRIKALLNMKEKIKKITNYIWSKKYFFVCAIPFIMMDLLIKILFFKRRVYPIYNISALCFSALWIILFVWFVLLFKGIGRIIAYWSLFIVSFIVTITNIVYYSKTEYLFSFNLLMMADEGSSYIWDSIKSVNVLFYFAIVIILLIGIFTFWKIKKGNRTSWKLFIVYLILFSVLHSLIPLGMFENKGNVWNSRRNIYKLYGCKYVYRIVWNV